MKKKFIALLLVLVFVIMLFPTSALAIAEKEYSVIVHFYNGENEYFYDSWGGEEDVRWGAYYWIDSGKVVESGTKDNQELDQEFSRETASGVNYGRVFRITLNSFEIGAIKAGKKLGLIMVRSYTDNIGHLTPNWCNNAGKDLNSDRYISCKFDEATRECHVWIIAGDKNNYESLEEAKSAFERVQSAKFDDFNTLIIQTTRPIDKSTVIQLYRNSGFDYADDEVPYRKDLKVTEFLSNDRMTAKITGLKLESDFDWNQDYQVYIKDVSPFRTSCIKTRLYMSPKFERECVPTSTSYGVSDVELGAIYSKESTTFRLWAPISTAVKINFYKTGNELDPTLVRSSVSMTLKDKGIWEATVFGDLNGVYYTYSNYVEGEIKEVVDVYAKATGVNGNRGMVVDLKSTNPDGWDNDLTVSKNLRQQNADIAVIWEVHVRDFSIAPDNGITYKGKYLAFTESGTHIKGDDSLATGIDYLKELGVNYVHLNPVFDFATVDEEYNNNTDYKTKQNWGYDPKNYNVPEGSYATNAEDGAVRINEFKQMVQALHNAGIGVIMDVVYNHTYTSDSFFEQTVPGYYYRQACTGKIGSFGIRAWATDALGLYVFSNGSGCSNETASERAMFRKYMIDSLVYWAKEYHLDGFRFDLMGLHDVDTMNYIRQALDNIRDDAGNKLGGEGILIYGEPWGAIWPIDTIEGGIPSNYDNLWRLNERISVFSDRIREVIRGDNGGGTGFVQGNMTSDVEKVKNCIWGYIYGVQSNGTSQTVSYSCCHDNYTLWDQLVYSTVQNKSPTIYGEYNAVLEKKNMMAATMTLTSRGKSFLLAGEEIARTKFGNHNSYNAQDKINAIDYYRQEDYSKLLQWYKGLIELRTVRFKSMANGNNAPTFDCVQEVPWIAYTYSRENASDQYKNVKIILNASAYDVNIELTGTWTVLANSNRDNVFDFNSKDTVNGSINVGAYGTVILVQK